MTSAVSTSRSCESPPVSSKKIGPLFELQLKDLDTVGINVATIDDYSEMADLLKQLTARCRPKL